MAETKQLAKPTDFDLLIEMAKDWTDPSVVRDAPERVPHVIAQLIEAIEELRRPQSAMADPPDFEQIAARLLRMVTDHMDPHWDGTLREITTELRQAWNGRGAADTKAFEALLSQRLRWRFKKCVTPSHLATASLMQSTRWTQPSPAPKRSRNKITDGEQVLSETSASRLRLCQRRTSRRARRHQHHLPRPRLRIPTLVC